MKPKLIVMSHGKLAYETIESAKMIVGDLLEAEVVSMLEEDGMSGTKEKLERILESYEKQNIVILTDLRGGTPCNVALSYLMQFPNLRIMSGLNLAMVIEYAVSTESDIDILVEKLQLAGQSSVGMVELEAIDEEEYEE